MEEVFAELSSLPCEQPERRDICKRCRYAHHYVYVQIMRAWLCVCVPISPPLSHYIGDPLLCVSAAVSLTHQLP